MTESGHPTLQKLSVASSVEIDGKSVDPTVLSKILSWEDQYLSHTEKYYSDLMLRNNSLINSYQHRMEPQAPIRPPAFAKPLVIKFPAVSKRPKGKMPVPVPRLIKAKESTELSCIPPLDSLKRYCELEQKLPELQEVYSKVNLTSCLKRKAKDEARFLKPCLTTF